MRKGPSPQCEPVLSCSLFFTREMFPRQILERGVRQHGGFSSHRVPHPQVQCFALRCRLPALGKHNIVSGDQPPQHDGHHALLPHHVRWQPDTSGPSAFPGGTQPQINVFRSPPCRHPGSAILLTNQSVHSTQVRSHKKRT